MNEMSGSLSTVEAVREFMLAGNATITIRSKNTGTRFTYKIQVAEDKPLYFVSLLNGQDNENSFVYIGIISNGAFRHTSKSAVSPDAPSFQAFSWLYAMMTLQNRLPNTVEVWHEGRCGRCGRKLTVPESVERGIGPECANKMAA